MKCKECRKEISDGYVKADGVAYHSECFKCAKCGKELTGQYQSHMNKLYHPKCYREKRGLTCARCKKVLEDSWVESGGKRYHSHCLDLRCGICKLPIDSEYLEDKQGKYHESCYMKRKAPQCSICDRGIQGKYIVDPWGGKAHETHGISRTETCDHCTRIISDSTSNGGYRYSDGRRVCGICKLTAITENRQVRSSLTKVLRLLNSEPGISREIPGGIPIQLVDRGALKRLGNFHNPDMSQGFTTSNTTRQNGKRIKAEYKIYLLYGMPRLLLEGVLAHELCHVWLMEKEVKLSHKEAEGFCNLGAAEIYRRDPTEYGGFLLKKMDEDPDRIYGDGYRKMKKRLLRLGWPRLKHSL